MAAKKSKKKNQSKTSQNNGLLGGKFNGIAVALLSALVTEIVQKVFERLFSSHDQSDTADAVSDSSEASLSEVRHNFHHSIGEGKLGEGKLGENKSGKDKSGKDNLDEDNDEDDLKEGKLKDNPVTATVSTVNDRLHQTKPAMDDVLKTIRATVEEATPRFNEAIAVLKASSNDPQQAVATLLRDVAEGTKGNLSTAADIPNFDGWLNSAVNATQAVINSVAATTPEKTGKNDKKKGKNKKGKKSKK
jgi:hypothetical protein